ncbi:MAG TPA: hypothetical protein PLC47_10350, partial [Bacteroidales bacterium]|nr:hypothetical protein [Bacteroidales bacterium]
INQKAQYYYDLAAEYWYRNADSSVYFAREGLQLDTTTVKPELYGKLYFAYAIANANLGESDSALYYLQKSRKFFKKHKNTFWEHRSLEQIGGLYRETGQLDSALIFLEAARIYFVEIQDSASINSVLMNTGNVWLDKGRNVMALKLYLEAAAYDKAFETSVDGAIVKLSMAIINGNLGSLFKEIEHAKHTYYFGQSQQLTEEAKQVFQQKKHQTGVCYSVMNEIAIHISRGDFKKADSLYQQYQSCARSNDSRLIFSFAFNQARVMAETGKPDSALVLLQKIDSLQGRLLIPPLFYESQLLKATLLYDQDEKQKAYQLAENAIKWFEANEADYQLYQALVILQQWQQTDGKLAEALQTAAQKATAFEKITADATNELFDELRIKSEQKLLQQQLLLSETKQKQQRLRFNILLLSSIFLLLAILMINRILFVQRKKVRLEKLLVEEESLKLKAQNLHQTEQLNKAELERQLQAELAKSLELENEVKEHKLLLQSLKQTSLTQLNQTTREKLESFKNAMSRRRDQEAYSTLLNQLDKASSREPLADFEEVFLQMHQGFYEKLLSINAQLSRSELHLCALLRLNLPSKEIAELLHITVGSVDQKRFAVRQKLKLNTDQNLTNFLIQL